MQKRSEVNGNVKDARLRRKSRRPRPFDPALRDLRMNRAAARFTNSTEDAKATAKSRRDAAKAWG